MLKRSFASVMGVVAAAPDDVAPHAAKKRTAKEIREAEKQTQEKQEREQELATATAKKKLLPPLKKTILCGAGGKASEKPRAAPRST